MRKYGIYAAVAGVSVCLLAIGIKFAGTSQGGVGVVDLDKVAAATGKSDEIRDALNRQGELYKSEIIDFRNKAQVALSQKNDKLKENEKAKGEEAIDKEKLDKDKLELVQQLQAANSVLQQAQNTAGARLNQLAQAQAVRFRNDLKPIIQEIAAKRGLSVVIPKNDGLLLAVQPGADITEEVTKAYQKRPVQAAPAPVQQQPASAGSTPASTAAKAPKATETKVAEKTDDEAAAPARSKEKEEVKGSGQRKFRGNTKPSDDSEESN